MNYNSSYYKCVYVDWNVWNVYSGCYTGDHFPPFSSGGLTETMANARNPKSKTPYKNYYGDFSYNNDKHLIWVHT